MFVPSDETGGYEFATANQLGEQRERHNNHLIVLSQELEELRAENEHLKTRIAELEAERDKYERTCLEYVDSLAIREARIAELEAKIAKLMSRRRIEQTILDMADIDEKKYKYLFRRRSVEGDEYLEGEDWFFCEDGSYHAIIRRYKD